MSDDDRDLAVRLGAIDVEPRHAWMAGLRADLAASWETGELPTDVDVPTLEPRWAKWRPWMIVVGLTVAAAAVISAVVVLTDPPGLIEQSPATTDTSPDRRDITPASTVPATVVPLPTSPPSATVTCSEFDTAALAYSTYTAVDYWTVTPSNCLDGTGQTEAFSVRSQRLADGQSTAEFNVTLDEIRATASGITVGVSDAYPDAWGNLALAGVTAEALFMRTDASLIRVDLATKEIKVVTFEAAPPPFETIFTTGVFFIGRSAFVATEPVMRADFDASPPALVPTTFGNGLVASGSRQSSNRFLPPVPDSATIASPISSDTIIVLHEDGTIETLPPIAGTVFMLYAGEGQLWALIFDPGQPTTIDPSNPSHLVRIDPATGDILASPESPPNSYSTAFTAFTDEDGILAISDRERVWWIDNEGNLETLAPLTFDVVGVAGGSYIARQDDGSVTTGLIADLPRVTTTATTTGGA